MFKGPLDARILIRELYGSYSDATCRQCMEDWLTCWSEDGVWAIFGKEFAGKAALRDQWQATWSRLESMGFFSELGSLEIDGDRATAHSYCREIAAFKSGKILRVVGHYADELVCENGNWVFARRTYSLLVTD